MSTKPESEKHLHTIGVPATDELFKRLGKVAAQLNVSKARVVRDALEAYLNTIEVK